MGRVARAPSSVRGSGEVVAPALDGPRALEPARARTGRRGEGAAAYLLRGELGVDHEGLAHVARVVVLPMAAPSLARVAEGRFQSADRPVHQRDALVSAHLRARGRGIEVRCRVIDSTRARPTSKTASLYLDDGTRRRLFAPSSIWNEWTARRKGSAVEPPP